MRFILIILLFPLFVSAQEFGTEQRTIPDSYDARGLWGYGENMTNTDLTNFADYGAVGVHYLINWNEIEPTDGGYDFSVFFDDIKRFSDRGFYITFQVNTGQDAPISGSTTWLKDLGVATFTTTGGNENGPYPDYYSTLYVTRLHALFDTLNKYIVAHFTTAMKRSIIGQYIVLGSTGDPGPFKGTACNPVDCLGYDNDETWAQWSRDQVNYLDSQLIRSGLTHIGSFNQANNHQYLEYLGTYHPFALTKEGQMSHELNFFAEQTCLDRFSPRLRQRGEAQGEILDGTGHAHKNGFQLIISALCLGLDYFNITGGWFNNVLESGESIADPRMTSYFVKYAPHNDITTATKGFIQLAQKFSFDDQTTFPTGTYGALIDPSRTTQYNNRVATINGFGYDYSYTQWLLIGAVETFINPARVTAIVNYGEALGASYNASASPLSYDNDFGYSLLPNYEFGISQVNANSSSVGVWRFGQDTSIFGRFGRTFNASGDPMQFDINNKWAGGRTSASIKFTITYLDSAVGTYKLFARTVVGLTEVESVTTTNTGKFKQEIVTVPNMVLGNTVDFSLTYISGVKTKFAMIEIELQ